MSEQKGLSLPVRILMELVLTIILVWLLSIFLERIFFVDGGLAAYIVIGSLLTLMNVIVRPILHVLTFPFKLFASIIALIIVNGGFLWITERIAERMDPNIVTLYVDQGIGGWIIVASILGIASWLIKVSLR